MPKIDTETDLDEFIRRTRLQSWIYEGVELEIEYAKLGAENKWLRNNDPENEDIQWNLKRVSVIQEQLKTVNHRIESLCK